ncbi:serine hydrolase domain-containing protein [Alteromonas antoniana]|uniref:serine hydrolase domain-containing protein n=1 Tax=Alteromonas antoniana TaxID=2803813 RepID=UPI001C48B711|nr:serine hydrolase domain-containing protein [Alteromonas antoniana]
MKTLLAFIPFFLLLFNYGFASEQQTDFKALMIKKYVDGDFHGGVLYSDSKGNIHKLALGLANPDTGEALTTEHRFAINSMGKMFTAILIMQLVEQNKVSLDDTLSKHLPEHAHPNAPEITIHQLLSHRSGIPDSLISQMRGVIPWDLSEDEEINAVYSLPLDFDPGSGFHYTNTGYTLLGRVVKKYREGNYEDILSRYIFEPLNMKDSAITNNKNMTAYFSSDGKVEEYIDDMAYVGSGQGAASLMDMYRFLSALGSDRLLSGESWEIMFTPHSFPSEVPEGAWPPPHQYPYGYGFSLMPVAAEGEEYKLVGHGGAGYGSNFAGRFLGTKKVVVIYNNMMKNPVLPDVLRFVASQ